MDSGVSNFSKCLRWSRTGAMPCNWEVLVRVLRSQGVSFWSWVNAIGFEGIKESGEEKRARKVGSLGVLGRIHF